LPLMVLPLMVFGWMLGYASETGAIAHFSAILTLQIILVAWLGPELAKHYKFAIFYLIFLVPFGDFLNLPLQNITANLTVFILHALNIPVYREGLFLTTPVGNFEVAVACSGLRFLIASIAIGTLFAHLTYRSLFRQSAFVVTLIAFSILANGLRAALLIFVAEKSNMAYGFGADHYVYGWVVFGLVMLIMFWLGGKFSDLPPAKVASADNAQTTVTLHVPGFSKAQAGLVILLLSLAVLWRMQLTTAPIVEKPAAALVLPGSSAEDRLNWGIKFVHPQRVSLQTKDDNLSYFRAEFAHRQQQGELISWNNKLFNEKIWTVSHSSDWPNSELAARHLVLSSLQGETLELVYWYQVGNTSTTKAWQVKLAQLIGLFSGDDSFGQINAVAIKPTGEHNAGQLAEAVQQLTTLTAP
ncbi:MAG: exosortase, partial [Gammaproteobacteria bacterium]|nr:exosortase [Gammaproteobacteria bacterium]